MQKQKEPSNCFMKFLKSNSKDLKRFLFVIAFNYAAAILPLRIIFDCAEVGGLFKSAPGLIGNVRSKDSRLSKKIPTNAA